MVAPLHFKTLLERGFAPFRRMAAYPQLVNNNETSFFKKVKLIDEKSVFLKIVGNEEQTWLTKTYETTQI